MPDYVQHNGRAGQGLLGTQATFRGYFQTFPDMHLEVDDLIADGDRVVARLTITATHSHPVQLGPNAPAAGAISRSGVSATASSSNIGTSPTWPAWRGKCGPTRALPYFD
jgi:hypothetical protein